MKIVIGSKNPTKIRACEVIFSQYKITGCKVESNVAAQPLSDAETREGAINRAFASAEVNTDGIGIGLEGGVMLMNDIPYLCNWGALVTPTGDLYTASGARIVL